MGREIGAEHELQSRLRLTRAPICLGRGFTGADMPWTEDPGSIGLDERANASILNFHKRKCVAAPEFAGTIA